MQTAVKIALAQINLKVGDLENNFARMALFAGNARRQFKADLIVFPELAITGYPPEDLLFRQGFVELARNCMERLAAEVPDIAILAGYPRRDEKGRLYNSAAWLADGRIQHVYDKQILPNYGVFDEKRYFAAGQNSVVVDLGGCRLGVTICEDIWEPGPVRAATAAGAQLIVNLNASPFHLHKVAERRAVLKARCRENRRPVVYVNLVGGQDELVFDGHSMAVDCDGNIVFQAPGFVDRLDIVEFDPAAGFKVPLPPSEAGTGEDRTQDDNAAAYGALVLAVRDYVTKNGFNGVVLGLSGGVDSALTLAIAVDALGADRVEAVMMPSRYTSNISLEDAARIAKNFGVAYEEISIEPAFESLLSSLQPVFRGLPPDTTEENLQARCRGAILMAISNKKRKLVLATGNKSELAVGYATLYGDMAGGFAPLKDVSKTRVYELCRYRDREAAMIPARVIERAPSAELAPDQKDEDSLPPYPVLDRILELYLEEEKSISSIVADGFDEEIVREVVKKVNRNEYKRRQAAPGVKITKRAFGRERRYPITNGYD
ncbi:MAG TPA: NAD+ synthase [Gammaproteobacteria bacterium]